MSAQNWLGIRCLMRKCPFRRDSLGAYCTLGTCNRRITVHRSQIGFWLTLSEFDPETGEAVIWPQDTVQQLVSSLPIKPDSRSE
jgi:hypothetical protein